MIDYTKILKILTRNGILHANKITWDKHLLINRFENAVNGDSDADSLSELKDKLLECHAPMILLAIVEHRIEVLKNG